MDERIKEIIIERYNSYNFKYDENKDIYSNFASQLFGIPYTDCLEFNADGTPNIMGKRRRMAIKQMFAYLFINQYGWEERGWK